MVHTFHLICLSKRKYDKYSVKFAKDFLEKREKDILMDRFVVGKTQSEIAGELGISQAQVSRLEKSAIYNIRKNVITVNIWNRAKNIISTFPE